MDTRLDKLDNCGSNIPSILFLRIYQPGMRLDAGQEDLIEIRRIL
jgi:hypothetical protein